MTAAGSNDTLGLQIAANNLAQDLQGAAGGTSTARSTPRPSLNRSTARDAADQIATQAQ
jgi:hypothetical protein